MATGKASTTLKPRDINILLLGETGVGKSTWLNGFANYLTYSSLSLASSSKSPLLHIIPTQFTITDSNKKEVLVKVGSDSKQENLSQVGQSATQAAKIHTISYNSPDGVGVKINLIDTPGMGDSRGFLQDLENMRSIMKTLKPLKKLDAICILLKPNEARLTLSFRYCLQELLGHLHKDTIRNILFCFTNTRATDYRPGESLKCLKTLVANNLPGRSSKAIVLNGSTIFCFDSEAFRYLAAEKVAGLQFTELEQQGYSQSWTNSRAESLKMINKIFSLEPHDLQLTLDLYYLRKCLDGISKPVVTIKTNLQAEITKLEKSKKEVQEQKDATVATLPEMMIDIYNVEQWQLPRQTYNVVCAHAQCCEEKEGNHTHYPQPCHLGCDCPNSEFFLNTKCESNMLSCVLFQYGNNCQCCSHPWEYHMFVDFETRKDERRMVNPLGVANTLVNAGMILAKNRDASALQRKVDSLKTELGSLQKAIGKLAGIFQQNAIDDDNDAVEEYLEHLIKEEKAGSEKFQGLQKLKAAYILQKSSTSVGDKEAGELAFNRATIDGVLGSLIHLKLNWNNLLAEINVVRKGLGESIWKKPEAVAKEESSCCIS